MIKITSLAFSPNGVIPARHACDGENVSPPLNIEEIPTEAKGLVLIIDDPDAPSGLWSHWLLWNIDPKIKEITDNSVPMGATVGTNDFGKVGYGGPCPPGGTHHYLFRVYALDTLLNLPQGTKRAELLKAMEGHIIDKGELVGIYSR